MSSLSFTSRVLVASFLLLGVAHGGVPNPHRRRVDGEQDSTAGINTADQFLSSFLSNIPDHVKPDATEKVSSYTTVSDPVPVPKHSAQPRTDIVTGGISTFAAVIGGAVAKFLAFLFKKKLIIAAIIVGILASLGLTATVSQDLVKVAEDVVAEHRLQKAAEGQVDDRMDPVKIAEETESLFSWILNIFNLTSWFGTAGNDASYLLIGDKTKELSVQQSAEKEVSAGLAGFGNVDLSGNTIATTDEDVIDNWKEENNVNPFTVADPESLNVDKVVMGVQDSDSLTLGVSSSLNEEVIKSEEIEYLRNGRRTPEDDSGLREVVRKADIADMAESYPVSNYAIIDPATFENEKSVKDDRSKDQYDDDEISVGKVESMAGKILLGNVGNTDSGVIEEAVTQSAGEKHFEYPDNDELPELLENSQAAKKSKVESEVVNFPSAAEHYHSGLEVNEVKKVGSLEASNKVLRVSELKHLVTVSDEGALLPAPIDQSQNLSDYAWLSDQAEARDTLAVGEDKQDKSEPALAARSDPIVSKLMANVDSGVVDGYAIDEEDDGHVGVTDGYRDLLATLRSVELDLEHTIKPNQYYEETI